MTITAFSRQNLKTLRNDVDAALDAVARQHGIQIELGNIRFSGSEFRVTVTANTKTQASGLTQTSIPAVGIDASKIDFDGVVRGNVLPVTLEGRKFRTGGSVFTLTGVKSRRKKYPFQGTGVRGGRYKFSKEQVQNGLI